jgi:hypothetical protein
MAEKQKYQISVKDSKGVFIHNLGADKEEEILEVAKQVMKNNGNRVAIQLEGDNRYTIILKNIVVDVGASAVAATAAAAAAISAPRAGAGAGAGAGGTKPQLGCRNGDACTFRRNCKYMCKQFKEYGTCSRHNCAFHHFEEVEDEM